MMSQRWRPVLFAALGVLAIWAVALVGFTLARNARVTADKVQRFVEARDLRNLAGDDRARALHTFADLLNALSLEERRKVHFQRAAEQWFDAMTEAEKGAFLDATMPIGFRQMIQSFEQLPDDQRRRLVDDALRSLREERARWNAAQGDPDPGTNGPVLSEELQAKVRRMGLQAFYNGSSAQTKAELAPVLEELQRMMETGRPLLNR